MATKQGIDEQEWQKMISAIPTALAMDMKGFSELAQWMMGDLDAHNVRTILPRAERVSVKLSQLCKNAKRTDRWFVKATLEHWDKKKLVRKLEEWERATHSDDHDFDEERLAKMVRVWLSLPEKTLAELYRACNNQELNGNNEVEAYGVKVIDVVIKKHFERASEDEKRVWIKVYANTVKSK